MRAGRMKRWDKSHPPFRRLTRLLRHFSEKIRSSGAWRTDSSRALRCVTGFMGPMLLAASGIVVFDPIFACLAAMSVGLVDVRGEYSLRLALLLTLSGILAGSAALGVLAAGSLAAALTGGMVVTLGGGLWRHLSPDYGPGVAVSSALMFFVSSGHPMSLGNHPALVTFAGALFGVLLQISHWPFRPQHPLRLAVAESWCALADLLEALCPDTPDRQHAITEKELALRTALNQSTATLAAAGRHATRVLPQLEKLNQAAARLGMRAAVLNTALETVRNTPGFDQLTPGFLPGLQSLTQNARAAALAVISRQPGHLAAFEVRAGRLRNLLEVLQRQVTSQLGDPAAAAQLVEILRGISALMPDTVEILRGATDRAGERSAFSLELLDAGNLVLRPLAAVLNLRRKVESALLHHTLRLTLLVLAGMTIFKLSGLPHGYWLPFTMVVVLQPEFGATRQRAAERMAGTLAGGILASSVLWLHPPPMVSFLGTAASIALFGFFVRRRYALAVVFVTIMVVLLTEATRPVTLAFTMERMGSTLAGGLMALAAALLFWPVWERGRFAGFLGQALHANTAYLRKITARLAAGGLYNDVIILAKRTAESSNSNVFQSLRRMAGDPKNQQGDLERAAALANGNQRITRALNVIALHLNEDPSRYPELLEEFTQVTTHAFHMLAEFQSGGVTPHEARTTLSDLGKFPIPALQEERKDPARFREPWIFPQLSRIIAELGAMILASDSLLKKKPVIPVPDSPAAQAVPTPG